MHEPKKALGIIPARFSSTRFPGKPLVDIAGKSMIQRVYEQAVQAQALAAVVVATDDTRIASHVQDFGGQVLLTRADHVSGTDRCAEVAAHFPAYDIVVNIQGDEPFLDPQQIDLLVMPLASGEAEITTLGKQIQDLEELHNTHVVKVVMGIHNRALYFSRFPIPFLRNIPELEGLKRGCFYKHIGLYGFKRNTLLELTTLPVSRLESVESLEQLRWLEHEYKILVQETALETIGIDVPEDVERALSLLKDR